jgi:hypothetical protein
MYRESLPTIERLEIDPALRSEWAFDLRQRAGSDWSNLSRCIGSVALQATVGRANSGGSRQPYWRKNDRLSADDIRELESYLEFLRHQYGIPEGATVFPKRDSVPVRPAEKERVDAA